MLEGIQKRIFGIEESLNQKNFMLANSSMGGAGSTMPNELVDEDQQELVNGTAQIEAEQQEEPVREKLASDQEA